MKRVIKIIFLSVLIQSIYCARICFVKENNCVGGDDEKYECLGNPFEGCVE